MKNERGSGWCAYSNRGLLVGHVVGACEVRELRASNQTSKDGKGVGRERTRGSGFSDIRLDSRHSCAVRSDVAICIFVQGFESISSLPSAFFPVWVDFVKS